MGFLKGNVLYKQREDQNIHLHPQKPLTPLPVTATLQWTELCPLKMHMLKS